MEDICRRLKILWEIEDIYCGRLKILREIEDIAHSSSNFKTAFLRGEGDSGLTLALLTSGNWRSSNPDPEQVSEVLFVLLLVL